MNNMSHIINGIKFYFQLYIFRSWLILFKIKFQTFSKASIYFQADYNYSKYFPISYM